MRDLEERGAVAGLEAPLRIRSDEARRMLVSSQLIDFGGERCILAVTRDIGELARTEQALHRAEDGYRRLLEQIPAVPYTFDSSLGFGSFGCVSPRGEALFGHSQAELARPDAWAEILHPGDRARVLAEPRRTDETGEPFDVEYRVITKEGRTVWVRGECAPPRVGLVRRGGAHNACRRARCSARGRRRRIRAAGGRPLGRVGPSIDAGTCGALRRLVRGP